MCCGTASVDFAVTTLFSAIGDAAHASVSLKQFDLNSHNGLLVPTNVLNFIKKKTELPKSLCLFLKPIKGIKQLKVGFFSANSELESVS